MCIQQKGELVTDDSGLAEGRDHNGLWIKESFKSRFHSDKLVRINSTCAGISLSESDLFRIS